MPPSNPRQLRVSAVGYLNTVPLVWGMLHGAERGRFALSFDVPSVCADKLASGEADIGIAPVIEVARQRLAVIPGCAIACQGAVRSILLISKTPLDRIGTLALDDSSRTSAMLARVILRERYGAEPRVVAMAPDLDAMLLAADAALVIGDPALRIDPAAVQYRALDLGDEWMRLTGLPMVFAVWAGPPDRVTPDLEQPFTSSCRYGLENLDAIVAAEAARRGFAEDLVRQYLTRHIVFEFGPREQQGMRRFLELARAIDETALVAEVSR